MFCGRRHRMCGGFLFNKISAGNRCPDMASESNLVLVSPFPRRDMVYIFKSS